ncbi:MAG TPA: YdcF family protein [Bryobacteraceae bacterium]|nr:YdcF family protein [Bryobacteraceae bacterium]
MFRLLPRVLVPFIIAVAAYVLFVASRIQAQSQVDEARKADVIIVMGAAEYRGRPSPVFRARIDHALDLYRRKLAPRILTTGGAGGDPVYTEGEVARNYLVRQGVPSEAILVENEGSSTWQSAAAAGEMMRRMDLQSAILVSDGYHIYRAKKMLQFRGIDVFGSPRPGEVKGKWRERWLFVRQAVGYALWQAGITI